jgi:hypothetical protein
MLKFFKGVVVAIALLGGLPPVYGQKSTEFFIPVGQSPGLSGKYTSLGKIAAIDARNQTITVADSGGTYTVKLMKRTQIWLDKSKLKSTNQKGVFADLRKGLLAEIKYENNQRKNNGLAEWIKVQITAGVR